MTTENLALFKGLGAKMNFLHQRQRVLAQNVSNADTPGYRPQDLVPVDFSAVVKAVSKNEGVSNQVSLHTTDGQHMPPADRAIDPKSKKAKETYEVAPAGNAVIMEEQLIQAGRTVMDYNLISNIYQKHVRMMQTALGRGG